MKNFLKYVIIFVTIIILFVGMLTLSSTLSSNSIKKNVHKSAEILKKEGNKRSKYVFYKFSEIQFDNYTDALMINTAYSIDNSTPLYSSFIARKNYIPGVTNKIYADSVGELSSASKFLEHDEVGELYDTVNGNITESFEYARYWHGYLCVLRPLLLILNLFQIRILLTVVLILLAINVFYNLYKKLGFIYMLIFLLGFIGIDYFYLGLSIQGYFIFLITMIFMKFILKKFSDIKNISICFLIVGMITNFFDLLTNPLITLFIPLILYFLLTQKERKVSIKENIFIFVKTIIPWILGYGLTWLSKWILVDTIYKTNVLGTALEQVLYRIDSNLGVSILFTIKQNIQYVLIPLIIDAFLIIFISLVKLVGKDKKVKFKEFITKAFPYLIIAIIPYLWYIIVKDHSFIHAFFTYRGQIITLITIPIIWMKYIELKD